MRHPIPLLTLAICLLLGGTAVHGQAKTESKMRPSMAQFANSQRQVQNLPAIMGAPTTCSGGTAAGFDCDGIDLMALMPLSTFGSSSASDIWGWTDPVSGNEYALMGVSNGTVFVRITDPANPVYVGKLPTHTSSSLWWDIKVYDDHAFIVSEANGHGMQVFDLTQLDGVSGGPVTFSNTAHYSAFSSSHNIVINEDSGFAYAVGNNGGGTTCAGGLHMIDISTPTSPSFAGCYSGDGYTHDAQCVIYSGPDPDHQGKEICIASNEDTITVIDVTNKSNPIQLSRVGYPSSSYVHQGWLTDDQVHFYQNDELDGGLTRTFIWDMVDLDNPVQDATHTHAGFARDHNLYTDGETMYQANYSAGLRILDITNRLNPVETAYFDTHAPDNSGDFDGAWSSYPYFASSTIIVSSYGEGLFILAPSVTNQAPIVSITAPSDGSVFPDGSSVNFTGTATDAEDGNIASSLSWTSDLDGALGTGGNINALLSVGTHQITASVTDSGGLSDAESISVTVTPPTGGSNQLETMVASGVSSAGWTTVSTVNTYTSMVAVCTPVYSNNTLPHVVRMRNVGASSFEIQLQNPSGNTANAEDVHCLVVEEGQWSMPDGTAIEAQKYLSTLTDQNNAWAGETQSYLNSYTSPVVFGQVMTTNDADWSVFWNRGSSRTSPPSSSALFTGKEVAEDTDVTRADETIGFVVIESGTGSVSGTPFEAALGSDSVAGVTNNPPYNYGFTQSFGSAPAVAIATQAAMDGGNGGWAVLYGASPLTASSIGLAIDEDQIGDSERAHTNEQVAYLTFESHVDLPLSAPVQPPVVAITAPADGSGFNVGDTINFTGTATDPTDGNISANLAWSSSLDGSIGSGSSINVSTLSGGNHTITASVTNSGGLSDDDQISIDVTPVGGGSSIETITVSGVSSAGWTTVNLANSYTSMVAVCTANYANNSLPSVVRMRNAAGSSFEVTLQNPSGSAINAEDLHCVAMEEGAGALSDGRQIEAQTYVSTLTDQNNSWGGEAQTYLQSYSTPVVLGQVMTNNDADWSVFWSRGSSRTTPPNGTSLWTGKHVGEDGDVTRADETIGFIVVEAGTGSLGGNLYEAAVGSDIVRGVGTSPPYLYSFGQSFTSAPSLVVLGQLAMDGGDGSWATLFGGSAVSSSGINLAVDEDQIANSERAHTTEQVGYLAFGSHINTTYGASFAPKVAESDEHNAGPQVAADLPKEVNVTAAYPNPFKDQITIQYTLPEPTHVVIDIYNMLGQKVQTLVDANASEGTKMTVWDGRQDSGADLSSGIYMVTLRAGNTLKTRSVVIER